jgi:hypothetical protein
VFRGNQRIKAKQRRLLTTLVAFSFVYSLLAAYAHLAQEHSHLDLRRHGTPVPAFSDELAPEPGWRPGATHATDHDHDHELDVHPDDTHADHEHEAPAGDEDCPWAPFIGAAYTLSAGAPVLTAESLPSATPPASHRSWIPIDRGRFRVAPKASPPSPPSGSSRA